MFAFRPARHPVIFLVRDEKQGEQLSGVKSFRAEVPDPGLLDPFIRYSYWAEVRMPPERRLAPGIVEIPPPGANQSR